MPNPKRNYILVTYDSDEDECYYEKLYCTKEEAKKFMIRQMYERVKSEYEIFEDNSIVENISIEEPGNIRRPVFTACIQFASYHVTLELVHSKSIPKTEVYAENLNQLEQTLLNVGYMCEEDYKFDWGNGTATEL